jgi:hypothetical protein
MRTDLLTLLKTLQNGTPLSRAKAKSWREFVAITATQAKIEITSMSTVKTVAPPFDFVVSTNTCMKGVPSGVVRTDSVSVTQKQKVIAMIQPRSPLPSHVHIIARGTTYAAFRTSSDMWAPASTPIKALTAPVRPRIVENGMLPHIMLSWKTVKTSLTE